MKEHILDLIIVENNEDHFKIWDDYFSKKFKIKVFKTLENALEELHHRIDYLMVVGGFKD